MDTGVGDWFDGFEAARRLWLEQNGGDFVQQPGEGNNRAGQPKPNGDSPPDDAHVRLVGHRVSRKTKPEAEAEQSEPEQ